MATTIESNNSTLDNNKSTLTVVATPIGNLEDLCPRAINCLNSVDLILVEDTRHFSIIAKRFSIKTSYISNHEHNERKQVDKVIEMLKLGKNLALVSDAGTPTISDPGYRLVRACHNEGITVSTIPGPCAAIAALSISGFPSDEFCFKGFAPVKSGQRDKFITEIINLEMTCIFYESTHRILKTAEALSRLAADTDIFIIRELTKKFEQYYRGKSSEVYELLKISKLLKGEFVVVCSKNLN